MDFLSGQVDALSGHLAVLSGQVDVLSGQVDGLSGHVNVLPGQVDGLSGYVDVLSARLDVLSAHLRGHAWPGERVVVSYRRCSAAPCYPSSWSRSPAAGGP